MSDHDARRSFATSAGGLLGGFAVARRSHNRQLGGAVLAAVGVVCTTQWQKSSGSARAGALLGTYLVAFGASHPLAKKIGAWPAVGTVAAVTAVTSMVVTW